MSSITLGVVHTGKAMLEFVADYLGTEISQCGKKTTINGNEIKIIVDKPENKFAMLGISVNGEAVFLEFDTPYYFNKWKENLNGWACGVVTMKIEHEFIKRDGNFNVGSVGGENG